MNQPFLVANPFGTFLVRCNSEEEVMEFITDHIQRCTPYYKLLIDKELTIKDYQVRDLREIPVYSEIKQKISP